MVALTVEIWSVPAVRRALAEVIDAGLVANASAANPALAPAFG
jgi:hypothetical protein